MGSSSIKAFAVGFGLIGVAILYFTPEKLEPVISSIPLGEENLNILRSWLIRNRGDSNDGGDVVVNVVKRSVEETDSAQIVDEDVGAAEKPKQRLFTKDELSKYDGGPNSLGLHLALLGEVFDVAKGAQHYKPGSSYSFFSGRDATRAYLTGDFTDEANADDVSDIDSSALTGLMDWLTFYQDEYPHVGRLIGRYYNADGHPTEELETTMEKIEGAKANKWLEDRERELFPSCNSEFNREKGTRVWCTKKSGGVDRNWVGVPRMYYKAGKDPRCVCVRETGPPSNDLNSKDHKNIGDLEFPNLKEYPNCPKDASSCKVNHP